MIERDADNAVLGGVCAGLAESVGMDVTVMRLLWIFLFLWAGFGILPYLILWVLMPKKGSNR